MLAQLCQLALGKYGVYICSAYGLFFVVTVGMVVQSCWQAKNIKMRLRSYLVK